jgi:thymidylate kinase
MTSLKVQQSAARARSARLGEVHDVHAVLGFPGPHPLGRLDTGRQEAVRTTDSRNQPTTVGRPPAECRRALLRRQATVVTLEGVWGAGKTTVAAALGVQLRAAGFDTGVVHYGPRHGVIAALSDLLEDQPLRSRGGTGGYAEPYHATIDVLLRLCREADHQQRIYQEAIERHQVVVIDHGVYSKLAYCLTVLAEQHPHIPADALLAQLAACTDPWWLHPDQAIFLDVPWPLARERAIARGHGGGQPDAVERLLFLPRFDRNYRQILAAHPDRIRRIKVGLRTAADVIGEAVTHVHDLLAVTTPEATR